MSQISAVLFNLKMEKMYLGFHSNIIEAQQCF